MRYRISRDLLHRILAHAAGSDEEVCGLLLGRNEHVGEVAACRNIAADPRRRFEIDPAALLAAHRRARARAGVGAVLGHYHSHPSGDPAPSACDAASAAADGALWLIVADEAWGAWRAVADGPVHGRFEPVDVVVTQPCAAESASPQERD